MASKMSSQVGESVGLWPGTGEGDWKVNWPGCANLEGQSVLG